MFKRIIIILVLCALGIVLPLLFIPAAIIAWTVFDDWNHPRPVEVVGPSVGKSNVTAEDPDWKKYFLPYCESPAEEAFLEAMISEYSLLPHNGTLQSSEFALEMQVKINPYRVDFVANKWLIVEIDGAAYHSSAEAIARDKVRDKFLTEDGYTVLRIPARTVFTNPAQAVTDVSAALAVGRVINETRAEVKAPWTIGRSLASISSAISDLDAFVTTASAVQKAMIKPKATFHSEKLTIDFAIEEAKATMQVETFCNQSKLHTELFDESYRELGKLLEYSTTSSESTMTVPEFEPPKFHPDAAINEAIIGEFEHLSKQRSDYFDEVKNMLSANSRMLDLVREALQDVGCTKCWKLISS